MVRSFSSPYDAAPFASMTLCFYRFTALYPPATVTISAFLVPATLSGGFGAGGSLGFRHGYQRAFPAHTTHLGSVHNLSS
jgi:hypothetical protein